RPRAIRDPRKHRWASQRGCSPDPTHDPRAAQTRTNPNSKSIRSSARPAKQDRAQRSVPLRLRPKIQTLLPPTLILSRSITRGIQLPLTMEDTIGEESLLELKVGIIQQVNFLEQMEDIIPRARS